MEGDIEEVGGIMVITNIRAKYHIKVPPDKREEAERALAVHEKGCPTAQSVQRGIAVAWDSEIEITE